MFPYVSGVCLATFEMKPGYFARIILKPQSPLWISPVPRSQVFPDSLGDPPARRSWAGCRWRWFRVWAAWQSPRASEDSASCLLGQLPSCQGLKMAQGLEETYVSTSEELKIRRSQITTASIGVPIVVFFVVVVASHIYPAISRIRLFYLWKMSTSLCFSFFSGFGSSATRSPNHFWSFSPATPIQTPTIPGMEWKTPNWPKSIFKIFQVCSISTKYSLKPQLFKIWLPISTTFNLPSLFILFLRKDY